MQPIETSLASSLTSLGYSQFNPMQRKALEAGLLEGDNFVVSAPTASGKTLLALLKIMRELEENKAAGRNAKIVYIVPLRALASEKHEEFREALAGKASVALSTGDLDSASESIGAHDVIVVTSEKMDSILRHKPKWTEKISLVVADEVHLLNDEGRGATLEVVLSKLRMRGAKILALSATVPNAEEVAEWLSAKLFSSTWRPTPLEKKICSGGKLYHEEGAEPVNEKRALAELVERALAENSGKGQAIVFVSTRRSAESVAKELSLAAAKFLSQGEKVECAELSKKVLKALALPTEQCKALAQCVAAGVAFHHAGLLERDRRIVEKGFKKDRCLKCIVATTTLAMGLDYPASWVVVRDLKRYDGEFSDFIPNIECQQMLGRAGRPRWDKRGVGVMLCQRKDLMEVRDKYVLGALEKIYSKLSSEPALRTHALALVASGECRSAQGVHEFFSKTFFAHQFGSGKQFTSKIEGALVELVKCDFVREKEGVLIATPVGKRVSELYLDPLTANKFVQYIKNKGFARKEVAPFFALLLEICGALEARPLPRVSKAEEQALWDEMFAHLQGSELEAWEADREALEKYKHAKIANAWANEESEQAILEQFDLPPGILHAKMRILEWLAYSMAELAFLLNAGTARMEARKLQKRLKYGVKEELLDLVKLQGIGRVRARRLWNAGLKNREEVRSAGKNKLELLVGPRVSKRLEEKGLKSSFEERE